ncbi:hypothetical protein RND81_07G050800 [Saponaria officinalis]|uniref:C3H1-type domain-containing protein n=1 Tax=Saponaria officinalis TaxID=3572 RepID=A0AAW1JRY2_SAPOF
MTTYFTSGMNFQNDSVSPLTPPPPTSSSLSSSSENPFFMKYLRSSLPSDYSSPYLNRPIINYYRGNITGSGGSSSGSNRTPLLPLVNVEEDMLIMDGVLVGSKLSSKGSTNSSLSSSGSLYKTELCKSWEDSGYCSYGCKCQFAHGQEELRSFPNRFRNLKKIEMMQVNKPKLSPSSSSASSRNVSSPYDRATTPSTSSSSSSSTSKPTNPSPLLSKKWSPMDDGITVSLPCSIDDHPTKADVHAYINNVLYGPTTRKRLPVFCDICPV